MDKEKELITLLQIETQEWEKELLHKWIKEKGIEEVYQECVEMVEDIKKRVKRLHSTK